MLSVKYSKLELNLARAEPWNRDVNPAGWWMTEKLDGLRAYWNGRGKLFLGNGLRVSLPDHLSEGMPAFPIDGELWYAIVHLSIF